IWRMRQFYEALSSEPFLAQAVREFGPAPSGTTRGEFLAQPVRELAASVPWGHHVFMLGKINDPARTAYALHKTSKKPIFNLLARKVRIPPRPLLYSGNKPPGPAYPCT